MLKIRIGPTLTDTINARKIAAVLKKDPQLGRWIVRKLRTKDGPKDLAGLLHVEGVK